VTAALLAAIARAPLWPLRDDEVEAGIAAVLAAESTLAAARAGLLVEADTRGLRSRTQAPTTQRWLTQRMRVSRRRAERVVREADLVAAEPVLRDALAAGRCSPEQAVVVGQVMAGLPCVPQRVRRNALDLLLEQCAALEPNALARAGRHLHEQLVTSPDTDERARLETDAQERADTAYRRRSLAWQRQLDGSVSGRFTLDPVGGQTFLTAISALSRRGDYATGAVTDQS
jgi:hypothetical protein